MAPSLPVSPQHATAGPQPSMSGTAHMSTTTLRVSGMTCGACTSAVESALMAVPGIGSVTVSLVMERAVVQHDARQVSPAEIAEHVEDRGFEAEVLSTDIKEKAQQRTNGTWVTTTVKVGGMTCGACTSAIERAFKDMEGVKVVNVSLLAERAVVGHDATALPKEKVVETIEDCGFDAELLESKPDRATEPGQGKAVEGLKTTTLAIEGMTCGACTSAVEGGFKDVPGMLKFNISLLAERAVITHDPRLLSSDQLAQIIEDRGFDARILSSVEEASDNTHTSATAQLKIYGLLDPEDAGKLSSMLLSKDGVLSVAIDAASARATISFQPSVRGLRAIVQDIEAAGFNALLADSDDNNAQLESLAKTKEIQEWYRAFRFSLAFAVPVFLTSMLFPMFLPFLNYGAYRIMPGLWLGDVVCCLLTIPVQFGIGKRFYISAFKSIRHRSPTMDVLVVMGTSAAFFFSCAAMLVSFFTPPHSKPATTFDTSTMLITFICLGRFLENRAKGQTSKALSRLMSLAPSSAVIYADPIAAVKVAERSDSSSEKEKDAQHEIGTLEELTVPTELLEVGDVVVLKPGDKIPADGNVISGESYVDESMVTGEAMPILKSKGIPLLAGTVNGAGRLDFEVSRAGRDTQLSQIVRLVQEAQTSRAPIQRVADMVAGYFVPIILSLGLLTFIGWMILSHIMDHPPRIFTDDASGGRIMVCAKLCIAVIVLACPCALGLATPTAVMVGTGVGAEQGILIKGGATLETATKVTHVVLDKTGTLTTGKMSVDSSQQLGDWSSNPGKQRAWWTIVGLAEASSEHPIARAILLAAKSHLKLKPTDQIEGRVETFEADVGRGISARIMVMQSTYNISIGNPAYLSSKSIPIPAALLDASSPDLGKIASAGTTTIHIAISGSYAGFISLADKLKPSARACITALHRMNISTSIVTGDARSTALHVASLLSIPAANVHASVLPSGKQKIIEGLQAKGLRVAMVGDGINDSPALATADVGISLSTGTDVAMEAADIVLMKTDQLLDIPSSLLLSRTIFRRIKTNLLWACVYNAIGLPIAMGFFLPWGITLPPMAAGAAMATSSVTVVCSSLLLKWWKRPRWVRRLEAEVEGQIDEESKVAKVAPVEEEASRGVLRRLLGVFRGPKEEQERGSLFFQVVVETSASLQVAVRFGHAFSDVVGVMHVKEASKISEILNLVALSLPFCFCAPQVARTTELSEDLQLKSGMVSPAGPSVMNQLWSYTQPKAGIPANDREERMEGAAARKYDDEFIEGPRTAITEMRRWHAATAPRPQAFGNNHFAVPTSSDDECDTPDVIRNPPIPCFRLTDRPRAAPPLKKRRVEGSTEGALVPRQRPQAPCPAASENRVDLSHTLTTQVGFTSDAARDDVEFVMSVPKVTSSLGGIYYQEKCGQLRTLSELLHLKMDWRENQPEPSRHRAWLRLTLMDPETRTCRVVFESVNDGYPAERYASSQLAREMAAKSAVDFLLSVRGVRALGAKAYRGLDIDMEGLNGKIRDGTSKEEYGFKGAAKAIAKVRAPYFQPRSGSYANVSGESQKHMSNKEDLWSGMTYVSRLNERTQQLHLRSPDYALMLVASIPPKSLFQYTVLVVLEQDVSGDVRAFRARGSARYDRRSAKDGAAWRALEMWDSGEAFSQLLESDMFSCRPAVGVGASVPAHERVPRMITHAQQHNMPSTSAGEEARPRKKSEGPPTEVERRIKRLKELMQRDVDIRVLEAACGLFGLGMPEPVWTAEPGGLRRKTGRVVLRNPNLFLPLELRREWGQVTVEVPSYTLSRRCKKVATKAANRRLFTRAMEELLQVAERLDLSLRIN